MTYYRRRTLEAWEEATALAAGAVVGIGVTYLARIWLRRSATGSAGEERREAEEEEERGAPGVPRPTEGATGRPR